jgi:hypothetical protein
MLSTAHVNAPQNYLSAISFLQEDKENHFEYYNVNAEYLNPNFYHMFFPVRPTTEEYLVFKELSKAISQPATTPWKLFTIGETNIVWFSFQKEYLAECSKIAKLFNMVVRQNPDMLLIPTDPSKTHIASIKFPQTTNIICLDGHRSPEYRVRQKLTKIVGGTNYLQKSSVPVPQKTEVSYIFSTQENTTKPVLPASPHIPQKAKAGTPIQDLKPIGKSTTIH